MQEEMMLICNISILNRYAKGQLDQKLSSHGFHWRSMAVLNIIEAVPGMSQNRIGMFLQTDKANVTKLIHQMEDDGFIYRENDTHDRRQKRVYLSEKGQEALPMLKKIMKEWENEIYRPFTAEERKTFEELHGKISKHLLEQTERI